MQKEPFEKIESSKLSEPFEPFKLYHSLKDFLTPQERILVGSGCDDKYMKNFYTPILVQDGFDIELVSCVRKNYKNVVPVYVMVKDLSGEFKPSTSESLIQKDSKNITRGDLEVILAPLDKNGESLFDPKFKNSNVTYYVDSNGNNKYRLRVKKE